VRKAAVLIIGGLALSLICTAQSGKIETLGPLTDTSVPDAIRQTLDSKGYRVLLDESTPACESYGYAKTCLSNRRRTLKTSFTRNLPSPRSLASCASRKLAAIFEGRRSLPVFTHSAMR